MSEALVQLGRVSHLAAFCYIFDRPPVSPPLEHRSTLMSADRTSFSRRQFVKTAAATVATATVAGRAFAAPAIATERKTDSKVILGTGDHRYEVTHGWAQLPSQFEWQTTHNVTVDRDGNVYVVHEGKADRRDHPAIFVFDREGKYVRSFGGEFAGGAHGMDLREEDGEEFLYVTSYNPKVFAKLSLKGDVVWRRQAPLESEKYTAGKDADGQPENFRPTNIAFLPDGGFLVADGYGSFWIHRYDKDANWQSCFGGPGETDESLNNPHGLWLDNRPGREPMIAITDRARHTVKYYTLDGKYASTLDGFLSPCHFDLYGDTMLVPDLNARVSLLDKDNKVIVHLADDEDWRKVCDEKDVRKHPELWEPGKFVRPHDACFDREGNIMVTEWVVPGRVSKLTRLS